MYPSSFRAEGAEQASLQPTITNTNTNFACFHGHGAPETSSFIHTPLPSKATSSPSLWGWEGGTGQLHPLTNRFCYSGEEEEGKKKKGISVFSFFSHLSHLLGSCYPSPVVAGGRDVMSLKCRQVAQGALLHNQQPPASHWCPQGSASKTEQYFPINTETARS